MGEFRRDLTKPTEGRLLAKRVLGYPDPLSVRPGDEISFMVSAPRGFFDIEFVRFKGLPEFGDAPEPAVAPVAGRHEGAAQPLVAGSLLRVSEFPVVDSFTLSLELQPTLLDEVERGIFTWSKQGNPGLFASSRGVVLRITDAAGKASELWSEKALAEGEWHSLSVTYDSDSGDTTMEITRQTRFAPEPICHQARAFFAAGLSVGGADLAIGSGWLDGSPHAHFNGLLTGPIFEQLGRGLVAAWDFAEELSGSIVRDTSGWGRHASVVNAPTRAVRGPRWRGAEVDPRLSPHEYDAIHFHEDSLEGAGWAPSVKLSVPEDWRSGVYAAIVSDGATTDEIPFYVRCAKATEPAVLFLAPTTTYLAYANELIPEGLASAMKDEKSPHDEDQVYLSENPEFGLSTYDLHRDGYGCVYSSRLRPILNWRSGFHDWFTGTYRHFPVDLLLVGLLERQGIPYSVATDEDLHVEGAALLAAHRVVITGSHMEYTSAAMLDALEAYLNHGGRLMYLGANSFYWVTSFAPGSRHMIEVRRCRGGNTSYYAPAGEGHQSTTGEPGGLWRNRGRAPNALVGVGFTAKGWGRARPYSRVLPSDDKRWAWVFDGVSESELIGIGGSVLGGAAGDELDRFDVNLGSPRHATVLARASGFSNYFQPVIDDYSSLLPDQGGSTNPNVRADMVVFETPAGGCVFSVGSICWIGSLSENGYDNAASRVTLNVLNRFANAESVAEGARPPERAPALCVVRRAQRGPCCGWHRPPPPPHTAAS
ncbi:MAG: N,N-dimethylformamidase beta subunit family domain-containing protein [Candidatus Limnocylindrales bacterium]|jgi:N,N-dimethylformamidase